MNRDGRFRVQAYDIDITKASLVSSGLIGNRSHSILIDGGARP
jgi:hypothetical protein